MFSDLKRIRRLERELKRVKQLDAKILINQMRSAGQLQRLADAEFQVSSQFGEDGILQYLIHRVGDLQHKFIECGVETYVEANTRFLLENNNWSGLVIDCDQKAMEQLRQDDIYWRHDFTSVGAFITRDNINELCQSSGFTGEIGLLSIDIDGNDYWVWKAINAVQPTIVSIEFNSLFGDQHPISIPYDPRLHARQGPLVNDVLGLLVAGVVSSCRTTRICTRWLRQRWVECILCPKRRCTRVANVLGSGRLCSIQHSSVAG